MGVGGGGDAILTHHHTNADVDVPLPPWPEHIWLCNQSFGTEQPAQIHTLYMTPSETRSMRMSHDLT